MSREKRGKLVFVTGGIRSGKSSFAEKLTAELGQIVTYVATAEAMDDEMKHRIELHRQRRPDSWITVEEPLRAAAVLQDYGGRCDAVLLDCLTVLISNLMFARAQEADGEFQKEMQNGIIAEIAALAETAREAEAHVVVVSNEVGMTLVADNFLGRQYQELVGRANQIVAALADEAYLVAAGYPIALKSERS